jgi:hypothetical protein
MKRTVRSIVILGALTAILALAGCGTGPWSSQEVAEHVASTFADPASGFTQETADFGSYLFGGEGVAKAALEPRIVPKGGSYTLYFSGNFGSFAWDPVDEAYERVVSSPIAVTSGTDITGTIASLFVQVQFRDANGDPVQLSQPLGDGTLLADGVVSMSYYRDLAGEFTNAATGAATSFQAVTDLDITGLADSVDGVFQSGTHARTFERTQQDRQTEGSLTFSTENLAVNYDLLDGGYVVTQEGTVTAQYNATITRNGSVTEVTRTAQVECSRQKTVTVTVEGAVVRVDITTGRLQ